MVFRPATPGFVVTLAATICLAVVSFGVPMLKSIYFLSATIDHDNVKGVATFGVLGYCLQTGTNQQCSNATVGWEFNPNALLSLDLPLNLEIPNVVVKWLTYVLVLHIVALGLAAISAVFGLLAHIREMAMTCFSSCISGMAASVALLAFIFDLVLFFVIRTRVRAVGGVATLGNGLWLTLGAWVMLFLSGFFFGIGRCCFSSRPRVPKGGNDHSKKWYNGGGWQGGRGGAAETGGISHSEAMRMDAIKAEQQRKAQQAEVGLPAFPTKADAEVRPLNKKTGEAQYYVEEDSEDEGHGQYKAPYVPAGAAMGAGGAGVGVHGAQRRGSTGTTYTTNYAGRGRQQSSSQAPTQPQYAGGYMQGAPGTRSIDAYNNAPPAFPSGPGGGTGLRPGQPYRQGSGHSTGYASNYNPAGSSSSPPPMPVAQPASSYLTPGGGAAVGEVYGHGARQTSYHSAVSHQAGQASSYSQYDPNQGYTQQQQQQQQRRQSASYGGYSTQGQGYDYGNNNTNPFTQPPQAPYADPYARAYSPPQQQQVPPVQTQYGMGPIGGAGSNPYVDAYSNPDRSLSPPQQPSQQQQHQHQYHDQPYSTQQQHDFLYSSGNVQRSPTAAASHVSPPWNHPGNTLVNSGNVGIGTTPTPANNNYNDYNSGGYGGGGGHGMPGGYPSENTTT
ncbi:hypothetical protein FRC16_000799, partial [Serendipita sp. 398]